MIFCCVEHHIIRTYSLRGKGDLNPRYLNVKETFLEALLVKI